MSTEIALNNRFVTSTRPEEKITFGLIGCGGFAREVMPFARQCIEARLGSIPPNAKIVFVEKEVKQRFVNGFEVIEEEEFNEITDGLKLFNVAVANSTLRQQISSRLMANGGVPLTLRAGNATAFDNNHVENGGIFCPNTMITSNVKIGSFFHCNIFSYVAHDCEIGDFVTFAPAVHCNGNVRIEDHVYVGTGAIIRHGNPSKPLVIGKGAIVGMGAVVTKDVPPGVTVVGNPARPLIRGK